VLTMGKPLKVGGTAWAYLVDSVSGELAQGTDAARYYAGQGTPPGKFVGKGLVGLGDHPGAVNAGDVVSPEMLYRMLVLLADPLTGEPLGRPLSTGEKAPVAGYDLTFTVPKSLSLMWAMGDEATRAGVQDVLERSVAEVIGWAEDHHVFCTRTGAQGARQEPVAGVVAATWLHYESRDGDPHLHMHCVALNKAQAVADGRWRALDGREIHQWLVAMSERHTGIVEDLMAERFGVAWHETKAVAGRATKREVEGVSPDMVAEFSRRTRAIEAVLAERAQAAGAERGKELTRRQLGALHGQAWRETRRKKAHRPLAEMTAEWAERARPWVGEDPPNWAAGLAGHNQLRALRPPTSTTPCSPTRPGPPSALGAKNSPFSPGPTWPPTWKESSTVWFLPRGAGQGGRPGRRARRLHGREAVATRARPRARAFQDPRRHQPVRPGQLVEVHHHRGVRSRGPPARRQPGHFGPQGQLRRRSCCVPGTGTRQGLLAWG
jgi:conjugative relaxase-like TrwC/TraI family protein